MSQESAIRVDRDGEVALITIDRPSKRNALDSATARALLQEIEDLAASSRSIILTGVGEAFCAGGDLEELERWTLLTEEEIGAELYASYQGLIRAVRSSPAIVIAAINGVAVGAGLDLALACDLRIASERARLGQVWVRLGIVPGTGGAWLTQALAGPTRAAEMLLTGEIMDADRALAAGLINRVVPPEELLPEARRLADHILAHPQAGVVANKRAINAVTDAALEAALEHAAKVQPERFTSAEFRAALEDRAR